MTPLLGRQGELLAQLHELITLPSSPPANKESAVGPLPGAAGAGPPPPAASPSTTTMATGGRRRRRSSERGWDDEVTNGGEHHGEDDNPAADAAARRPRHRRSCKTSRKKKQQSSTSSMVVTSAPDLFDGYQWRKYGQKQIEGAMYPRSYYRCTRSADQGCAAKRTVQRNADADDDGGAAATPKYTVVRVGEHTCTATDSPEAPVILETTAVGVVPASNSSTAPTSSAAASCSTTTAGTESPAITGNTLINSRIASSSEHYCYVDDDYHGLPLAAAVHDNDDDWPVPTLLAASSPSSSFPRIEDFAGPIRSPVHITAADCWTMDHQFLLQLVNEPSQPTICLH